MNTKEIRRTLIDNGFTEESGSKHWLYFKNGLMVKLPHGTGNVPWAVASLKTILRRAERTDPKPIVQRLRYQDAVIGRGVKARIDFVDVPKGTTGRIVEDYDSGVMIEWDLPAFYPPLRDGFDKSRELIFLEPA